MKYYSKNVIVEPFSSFEPHILSFKFIGRLTDELSNDVCHALDKELDKDLFPSGHTMIWNCKDMKSFDWVASTAWIEILTNHKEKISKVFVISTSSFIRSAAQMIFNVLSIEFEMVKSASDINFFENDKAGQNAQKRKNRIWMNINTVINHKYL